MNIAFIFAYREDKDIWSTPLSIVEEFKSRGWNTHIVSLFDDVGSYTDEKIKEFINYGCDLFNPDIIMYMDWGRFDSIHLDKRNIPSAYWIQESADDPQNFERNSTKAHKFDLVLTPAHDSYLKYKEMGCDVEWLNHFADTRIHHPYMEGFVPKELLPDVRCTRGPGGSQFLDYISQIMPNKFHNKNGLTGTEYGEFLSGGYITLQNSRWKEVTRRIFEGMACGTMVLTDRLPEHTHINDLFTENEDIVYYDGIDDCIAKINYYLYNQQERLRIAQNGYAKVLYAHTQVHRVNTILDKWEQWKTKSH